MTQLHPQDIETKWYTKLPRVWTNETIWPQSAIESLRNMGESTYMQYIDDAYLQSLIILHHPNLKKMTLALAANKNKVVFLTLKLNIISKLRGIRDMLSFYLFDKYMGNMKIYRDVRTIEEAEDFLSKRYTNFIVK